MAKLQEFVKEYLRPLLGIKKLQSNSQWKYLTLHKRGPQGFSYVRDNLEMDNSLK